MSDFTFFFLFGWDHIISINALDHLLFIAALSAVYMLKDWKQVIILVTAFTIGHSITLALTSLNLISFPTSWIEFFIPLTIIITAISNLFLKNFTRKAISLNYFLALFFGLIHGLAFANLLAEILATDQSFAWSMFSFSVGLELGQILVVMLTLMVAQLFVGKFGLNRRSWVFVLSGIVLLLAISMAWERLPAKTENRQAGHGATNQNKKESSLFNHSLNHHSAFNEQRKTHEDQNSFAVPGNILYDDRQCPEHTEQSWL